MIDVGEVKGRRVVACHPGWVVIQKIAGYDEWIPCVSSVAMTRIDSVCAFNRMNCGPHEFGFGDESRYAYTALRRKGLAIVVKVLPNFNV